MERRVKVEYVTGREIDSERMTFTCFLNNFCNIITFKIDDKDKVSHQEAQSYTFRY